MQNAGIFAAAHNRGVSAIHAVFAEGMQKFRFDFILIHPHFAGLHGASMGKGGDLRGVTHDRDFCLGFEQTHVMQHAIQHNNRVWGANASPRLRPKLVNPANHLLIKFRIRPQIVMHLITSGQQTRH